MMILVQGMRTLRLSNTMIMVQAMRMRTSRLSNVQYDDNGEGYEDWRMTGAESSGRKPV